jgi:hypothetical protein
MSFGGLAIILMSSPFGKATAMPGFHPLDGAGERRFWMAATGRKGAEPEAGSREAVVHDPPRSGRTISTIRISIRRLQRRFADVIAKAMHDKRWKNPDRLIVALPAATPPGPARAGE